MATAAAPMLRILCLHDGNSTAGELKEQLHLLGEKLYTHHAIDLVYVNSPLTTTEHDRLAVPRVWWNEASKRDDTIDKKEPNANAVQPLPDTIYHGLDASLMLLRQIWTSCPFWGIIGVGQGAAVASLLLAVLDGINEQDTEPVDGPTDHQAAPSSRPAILPLFAVFVAGESLVPVDEPILTRIEDVLALHLVDFDPTVANDNTADQSANAPKALQQQRLMHQFPHGSVEQRSSATSSHPQISHADLNRLGRFVTERKKELLGHSVPSSSPLHTPYRDVTAGQVLVLQTALHYAEQDAATCIADAIALDPPPALMAVIRPHAVAGWKGNRRRQPGDEGGGAPCPSEFVLQARERSGTSGASRVHPEHVVD